MMIKMTRRITRRISKLNSVGCWNVGCGVVVSHISEDLYNLAWTSGPPVVGIEDERYSAHSLQQTVDRF